MKNITAQHKRFVEQYCSHFNGARAAREAGYAESRDRQTARDLLNDPDINAMVEERLEELAMSAAEATKRMADIARSDIADFFTYVEPDDDVSEDAEEGLVLNRKAILEKGGGIIQELNWGRYGPKLKLYDAKDALKNIMDAHGVFNHKQEIEHSGNLDIKGVDFSDD